MTPSALIAPPRVDHLLLADEVWLFCLVSTRAHSDRRLLRYFNFPLISFPPPCMNHINKGKVRYVKRRIHNTFDQRPSNVGCKHMSKYGNVGTYIFYSQRLS